MYLFRLACREYCDEWLQHRREQHSAKYADDFRVSAEHGRTIPEQSLMLRGFTPDPATVKLVKLPLNKIMIDEGDFTRNHGHGYFRRCLRHQARNEFQEPDVL
jgi:hypothetical protein